MKNNKKLEKKTENEISNMEKNLEKIEKVKTKYEKEQEKIKKEARKKLKKEKERLKKVNQKVEAIRDDLKEQLENRGLFGKHFDDMIEDYIKFVKLKEDLQYDIEEKGIRYKSTTGNGFITDKPNESITNLIKVNGQMLKILQDLELKEPDENSGDDDSDDLL